MKKDRLKMLLTAAVILALFAWLTLGAAPASPATAAAADFDAAATYKAKCQMCHTANASKFFDPAKSDDELAQVVLKGRKGEKPPFMPAFETKNVTEEQAKALIAHMRSLRQ
jgi:mono/diheme cytochrome c family protein